MKRCAVINDISGFGKCSLMASLPVLAVMGVEAHPIPTSVLTLQTGYDNYSTLDLTDFMPSFISDWEKNSERFDAVLTGFISSPKQFAIINKFVDTFSSGDKKPILIVDPVMADDGVRYDLFDDDMCNGVASLALKADIITPNVSELAIIAHKPYSEDKNDIASYAKSIVDKGVKNVVVTGWRFDNQMHTLVFGENESFDFSSRLFDGSFSGTGDLMSAVITGAVLRGQTIGDGVMLAGDFISKSIESTPKGNRCDGIDFEKYLGGLI